MLITFTVLYFIYGLIIGFVAMSLLISQHRNSYYTFRLLSLLCILLSLFTPIYLKYFSNLQFANSLVNVVSPVTGFLFAIKMTELAFTYTWLELCHISLYQIGIDFSTFPLYKYQSSRQIKSDKRDIVSFRDFMLENIKYLILSNKYGVNFSPFRQNCLIIIRGLFDVLFLIQTLKYVPYHYLQLHSKNFHVFNLECVFTYFLYGFILYFALGMVANVVFGLGGLCWNISTQSVFPEYPFLATSLQDFWSHRWNIYVKQSLHR
ncbi:unnamed protein product [Didymodactylos carnosus]|nr:unnamed protein product [Didymodactylos carnosus]CAF3724793.1 unnamed protein product [Didymodactylos carnosus]